MNSLLVKQWLHYYKHKTFFEILNRFCQIFLFNSTYLWVNLYANKYSTFVDDLEILPDCPVRARIQKQSGVNLINMPTRRFNAGKCFCGQILFHQPHLGVTYDS